MPTNLGRSACRKFGFVLIATRCHDRIRDAQRWEDIGHESTDSACGPLKYYMSPPYWVEPHRDRLRCIWWWGNSEGVDRFKQWAERMSLLMEDDSTLLGGIETKPGTFETLHALCLLAGKRPELSSLFEERIVRVPARLVRRHCPSHTEDGKPVMGNVFVQQVFGPAATFAHKVASHLLGHLPKGPRLTVNPETNTAILDNLAYELPRELILILHVLYEANGEVVSMPRIQEREPDLQAWRKPHRLINIDLKNGFPKIFGTVESVGKAGVSHPKRVFGIAVPNLSHSEFSVAAVRSSC